MKIEQIITGLLIENPYYGYLASKLRYKASDQVKHVKVSWDSNPIFQYNQDWFDGLPKDNQIGIVVHELLHIGLLHFYRRGEREIMLWNVACDIAVSELMKGYSLPSEVMTLPLANNELGIKMTDGQSAEYYYQVMNEMEDRISFTVTSGDVRIVFEGGEEYVTDIMDEMLGSDLESQAMIEELTKVSSHASDEISISSILREQLEDVYKEYRIQWRSVLQRFLEGHGKIRTRKSYKRQSRRFGDLPGTKRGIGLQALLAIDESASISDQQIKVFHSELLRINRITGDDILVVRFDTECSKPVPLQLFITADKRTMRGGTDFRPVFEMADRMHVKNVVLFTDGDGEAPLTVQQRVLWVLTNNGKNPADYGISVRFEQL